MAMLPHEPCSIVVRPSPASKPPRLSFSLLLLLEWAPRSSAPRGRPMSDMRDAIVVLLAGGQGERLWPLTRDRAKPAPPFPPLYRTIPIPLSPSIHSHLPRPLILTPSNP